MTIKVEAFAIIDIPQHRDFHIKFEVEGSTPEEQKQAADEYAKKWAEWNGLNARSIKTFIGVPESQIDKIKDWVNTEFS
jgi:hypothetical protein